MSQVENNDVLKRIEELLSSYGWSVYKLSREAKIPYSSLNNIFVRNTQPTIPTLMKICDGFQISLSEFFHINSIPDEKELFSTVEIELVHTFRSLSRTEKKLLLAYLDGLTKK